jgi:hypothetical protein
MLTPIDGWTIAHGLVGFFLGRIKINRWLFYPVPIGWEIYQLYFHYQPKGIFLAHVWPNSLVDILACIVCYEVAVKYSFNIERYPFWTRVSNKTKAIIAYVLITLSVTWVFYDDIFRGGLWTRMPMAQLPLVLGALSPAIASFIVWIWIKRDTFRFIGLLKIFGRQMSYYLFTGVLPSVVVLFTVFLVITLNSNF